MNVEVEEQSSCKTQVVIVCGLAGAGKSTVLNVFEDLRYLTVDGLPVGLVPKLVGFFLEQSKTEYRGLVIGMDPWRGGSMDDWSEAKKQLLDMGVNPQIIFIEASPAILLKRYQTTRRPHPLEATGLALEKALESEAEQLDDLKNEASLVLDTSDFSVHDLRRKVQQKWTMFECSSSRVRVQLITFGFKYGVPREADFVFDLRFLPNPYFDPDLRPLSGKDKAIQDYVLGSKTGSEFIARLNDFVSYLVAQFEEEGRYRLTFAIGCTGGRHRSVSSAEALYKSLTEQNYSVSLEHRHLELG